MADLILVSEEVKKRLCQPGTTSACSFLVFAGSGQSAGFCCSKNSGGNIEATIIARRVEKTIRAKGDNCSGPPEFLPLLVAIEAN